MTKHDEPDRAVEPAAPARPRLPRVNAGGAFDNLPVIEYQGGTIGAQHLVTLSAVSVVNPRDDIVVDFGATGLWARMNDASWLKQNNS